MGSFPVTLLEPILTQTGLDSLQGCMNLSGPGAVCGGRTVRRMDGSDHSQIIGKELSYMGYVEPINSEFGNAVERILRFGSQVS